MTAVHPHLTEDERQTLADGTISPEQRSIAEAHLAACPRCADDVARLTTLMKRVHESPPPNAPLDELWPSIRARIEQTKVIPLGAATPAATPAPRRAWWVGSIGVAAALMIAAFALQNRAPAAGENGAFAITDSGRFADSGATLVSFVDSAHAYEREAQILLNRLELQRAMLRPDVARALAHDLHVVDVAIAELKEAVAREPRNPALRQLLATSYRQKVDLLKRVSNAS